MAVSAATGMKRDQAFCADLLRYRDTHAGPNDSDRWSEEKIQDVVRQWKLSPEMEQRLRDLQKRIVDVDHFKNAPEWVVRYMHGPWGCQQAEIMFRRMIDWRIQNQVDTIFDDYVPPQLLLDCVPSAFLKDYDRDGDPIYVERGGSIDAPGLMKVLTKEEMIRYCIWSRERNTNGIWRNDYERRQGKCVKAITIVYDLKGLSSRHLSAKSFEYFKEIMKITQEHFPNPIKRMFIIRAPKAFQAAWNVIKHFFPATARAKMVFLGNSGYLEVLDKYVDINVLPRSIYEEGSGDVAVGMMQHLDGVESVQAYLDGAYPSKVSTVETDEESLSSDSFGVAGVNGKVILRGKWRRGGYGNVEVACAS